MQFELRRRALDHDVADEYDDVIAAVLDDRAAGLDIDDNNGLDINVDDHLNTGAHDVGPYNRDRRTGASCDCGGD